MVSLFVVFVGEILGLISYYLCVLVVYDFICEVEGCGIVCECWWEWFKGCIDVFGLDDMILLVNCVVV